MMKAKKHLRTLLYSAVLCAFTALATAFIRIPTGMNEGYIHLGDAIIYLAACLIPQPYALALAAAGGALADLMAAAPIWMLPTAIIKALNTLPFLACSRQGKLLTWRSVLFSVLSGLITVVGYFLAETLIYSLPGAVFSLPFSALQALGASITFVALGGALDRLRIRTFLYKENKEGE